MASRSDWKGAHIGYEAASSEAIVKLSVALEGSGAAAIVYTWEVGLGFDGRYNRQIGPKFTVNGGPFPLLLTATDALGRTGSTRCTPGVTVGL